MCGSSRFLRFRFGNASEGNGPVEILKIKTISQELLEGNCSNSAQKFIWIQHVFSFLNSRIQTLIRTQTGLVLCCRVQVSVCQNVKQHHPYLKHCGPTQTLSLLILSFCCLAPHHVTEHCASSYILYIISVQTTDTHREGQHVTT